MKRLRTGECTILLSKTRPKLEPPFKCYIYETKGLCDTPTYIDESGYISYRGRGQVIGEFVCDRIVTTCGWRLLGKTGFCAKRTEEETNLLNASCPTIDEIVEYANGENKEIYGWHISDLVIYDTPKELGEFKKICQSCDLPYIGYPTLHPPCNKCGRKIINYPFATFGYVEEQAVE